MEQGIAARVADRAPAGVLEPVAPLTPVPPPRRRPAARDRWLALVSLGAALVPAVVAAVRAATGDWVPVGESALIAVRSGDVLRGASGGGVPMVGPWADTSGPLGFDVFHPGPLLYDVLAVPVQLAGSQGLAMAVAAVNAVAIVGIFLVVRRVAGETMAALAMALVAVLCWVTGTAALIEPGYPGTVVLPFLWFLVLVWGATCGRVWCLPVAVVVGGFVGGTDLRVTLFVPVLLVVAGVSVARSAWGLPVRRWSRPAGALAVSGLLAVGCLVQPVLEELQGEGGGNLVHLWEGAAEHTTTLDVGTSARVLARVVALPPWWVRPWHADDFGVGPGGTVGPPLALAVVALVGLTIQGVVRLRDARRRGDRATSSGIAARVPGHGPRVRDDRAAAHDPVRHRRPPAPVDVCGGRVRVARAVPERVPAAEAGRGRPLVAGGPVGGRGGAGGGGRAPGRRPGRGRHGRGAPSGRGRHGAAGGRRPRRSAAGRVRRDAARPVLRGRDGRAGGRGGDVRGRRPGPPPARSGSGGGPDATRTWRAR